MLNSRTDSLSCSAKLLEWELPQEECNKGSYRNIPIMATAETTKFPTFLSTDETFSVSATAPSHGTGICGNKSKHPPPNSIFQTAFNFSGNISAQQVAFRLVEAYRNLAGRNHLEIIQHTSINFVADRYIA